MSIDFTTAHRDLWKWCRARNFAGDDPFDALNSRLLQATPLKKSRIARMAWTQFFKRSPVNFRRPAIVPQQQNPKGIALFALAALADYRRLKTVEAEGEALALVDDLLSLQLKSKTGAACWGYDFDWQSRAFFAPRGTPTVVPTAFAARALIEASQAFSDNSYAKVARSACDFILSDLNRGDKTDREVCFSYSPLDRSRVFNASLLAAETLAAVGKLTKEDSLCDLAIRATRYVINRQRDDGSWVYGAASNQGWIDNFHTAFVLQSLERIISSLTPAGSRPGAGADRQSFLQDTERALQRGYEYWRERFFLENGWPKYFPDRLYPADAHSAGAAIVTFVEMTSIDDEAVRFARRVAKWTIDNMRDPEGFFYYQRRRFHTVRTPYMRWSESWMIYALARLLEGKRKKGRGKKEDHDREGY